MKFSIKDFFSKCDQIRRKLKLKLKTRARDCLKNAKANFGKSKIIIQELYKAQNTCFARNLEAS